MANYKSIMAQQRRAEQLRNKKAWSQQQAPKPKKKAPEDK